MSPKLRFLARWSFRLALVCLVLLFALYLSVDAFARRYVERQISAETGMTAKVGKVRVGVFSPGLTIKNFVLYNTKEFGGSPLIELAELHVEYDAIALMHGNFHSRLVRFNLRKLNIVQNANGIRNIDVLGQSLVKTSEKNEKAQAVHADNQMQLRFGGVDKLDLTLGTVSMIRLGIIARTNDFPLNVQHQFYYNIKSEQDFSGVLIAALLKSRANILYGPDGSPGLLELLAPKANHVD